MGPSPVLLKHQLRLSHPVKRRTVHLARQKCETEGCLNQREMKGDRERRLCTSCRKRGNPPKLGSSRPELAKWFVPGRGACVVEGCGRLQEVDVRRSGSIRIRPLCQPCRKAAGRVGALRLERPIGSLRADRYGYMLVKTERGWEREHRMVMERVLGRALTEHESVHHINGVKSDNRPENLELRTRFHGAGQAWCCEDCGSRNVVPVGLAA